MTDYEIVEYPNEILQKPATLVKDDEYSTDALRELVNSMISIANDREANGLAAVQIGVDKAVVIYRDRAGILTALCNPEIIGRHGKVKSYSEGCLSSPDLRIDVRRSKEIKVKAFNLKGQEIIFRERGFSAIVLQHEIDHINGMTLAGR